MFPNIGFIVAPASKPSDEILWHYPGLETKLTSFTTPQLNRIALQSATFAAMSMRKQLGDTGSSPTEADLLTYGFGGLAEEGICSPVVPS